MQRQADVLERYKLAQKTILQSFLWKGLIRNDAILPHWIDDSQFWYRRAKKGGVEFRLVNAERGTNELAFDHETLASAIGKATGKTIDPENLPLKRVKFSPSSLKIDFQAFGEYWQYNHETLECTPSSIGRAYEEAIDVWRSISDFNRESKVVPYFEVDDLYKKSSDGRYSAFARQHNIWLRDVRSGEERQLTFDGQSDYSYGPSAAAAIAPDIAWSPDSKRLAVVRKDERHQRNVAAIDFVPLDGSLAPKLYSFPVPMPGDENIPRTEILIFDVNDGTCIHATPPSAFFGVASGEASLGKYWWSSSGETLYYIDPVRDLTDVRVVAVDVSAGTSRVILEERSATYVSMSAIPISQSLPLMRVTSGGDELIWYSERSGWGHLYLYDLKAEKQTKVITTGEWMVHDILYVDEVRRELLIQTTGRTKEQNPYYRDICRLSLDSGDLVQLAGGNYDIHVQVENHWYPANCKMHGDESAVIDSVSPNGQFVVVTKSRVDMASVSYVIDRNGEERLPVERACLADLPEGWCMPEPVSMKAADGETDIFGVVFRPLHFDASQKYPVIDMTISCGRFAGMPVGFSASNCMPEAYYMEACALSTLGFVVVMIDGRGSHGRDKGFRDHDFGNPSHTALIEDRIGGIRQLAERYPEFDINRVGISEPEQGEVAQAAMIFHGDFYKVGVIHICNDYRLMNPNNCAEVYFNIRDTDAMRDSRYPEYHAEKLKGKLLLVFGTKSGGAGGAASFRFVEALQRAGRDFDMICLPNMLYEKTGYTTRREWDYFVTHLLGMEPPKEFKLLTPQCIGLHGVKFDEEALS